MHAIEKILARNSGRESVRTGEIVTVKVDFAEINDLYLQTVYSFYEMGGEKSVGPGALRFRVRPLRPLSGREERVQPPGDAGIREEERPALPF